MYRLWMRCWKYYPLLKDENVELLNNDFIPIESAKSSRSGSGQSSTVLHMSVWFSVIERMIINYEKNLTNQIILLTCKTLYIRNGFIWKQIFVQTSKSCRQMNMFRKISITLPSILILIRLNGENRICRLICIVSIRHWLFCTPEWNDHVCLA